jgi:hypothetical protein
MRLDIKNIHKLVDSEYHNGRFVCTNAIETETNYRFQFCDHNWPSARYVWIEVSRIGHRNLIEDKWEYRLNYPNRPIHIVTAEWLSFPPNAVKLMEDCLNYSL